MLRWVGALACGTLAGLTFLVEAMSLLGHFGFSPLGEVIQAARTVSPEAFFTATRVQAVERGNLIFSLILCPLASVLGATVAVVILPSRTVLLALGIAITYALWTFFPWDMMLAGASVLSVIGLVSVWLVRRWVVAWRSGRRPNAGKRGQMGKGDRFIFASKE